MQPEFSGPHLVLSKFIDHITRKRSLPSFRNNKDTIDLQQK